MAGHPAPSSAPQAFIDLCALASNYRLACRLAAPSSRILAMVKADAYGHGIDAVVRCLAASGCEMFGVATCAEAQAVTGLGPSRVVVFGGVLAGDADALLASGAEVVACDPETLRILAARADAAGRQLRVHLGVDTGMRRLGAEPHEMAALAELAVSLPCVSVVGLCSHFAEAEAVDSQLLEAQLTSLEHVARSVEPIVGHLELHAANSAGLLGSARARLDLARPGLMLYGLSPRPGIAHEDELQPVMRLSAVVIRVASLAPGEGVGYGHAFHTARPTTLATLRIGYGDGYPRALSGCGSVFLGGGLAPVVGRVCMDHIMVDATDVSSITIGDEAVLWGPELRAETVAEKAGTISYELVSRVSPRVTRTYVDADLGTSSSAIGGKIS
ncbi:MAG: alanine racemase [Hyphomicrobiaceae bacterium]|jgi:alanine racemase